jgi:type I restriction enzyme M protein
MSETTNEIQSILFDGIPLPRTFEDRLWATADDLRAGARLKSSEYAAPLLSLFFLRYASNRFNALTEEAECEFEKNKDSRNSEALEEIYKRLGGFYLPAESRYERLLELTDADNIQQTVSEAMEAFEKANPLAEVTLPKNDFIKIPNKTLREIINKVSEIKVSEGDVFGKIYEYFLGKFALTEGAKGGEFYTPTSVVKLIVEVIEPFKADARVFDPACGTGGMFVQSAKFVERHVGMQRLSIYGQEKVNETANLGRLNLFVNGLKGDIRSIDSSLAAAAYTDDHGDTFGKFDFVMANPPFNVDGVKLDDIGGHPLFATYGLPLSTAKSGKKSDTFANANYLWISLFATALNKTGRAGFVMANSASDGRSGELQVRQNLVEAGMVDVMITLASNFFYTVTLPVTLWFFDKAKTNVKHPRHDHTLFIDARRIYTPVHGSRSLREFTQAQLLNIASIMWLYRGESGKFHELRDLYGRARDFWRDGDVTADETQKTYKGIAAHREQLAGAFRALATKLSEWIESIKEQLTDEANAALLENAEGTSKLKVLKAISAAELLDKGAINDSFKRAEEGVVFAEKVLRPPKDKTFKKTDIRGALKRLAGEREDVLFVLERIAYFEKQAEWLDANFPGGVWRDVEGLCKIATRAEIAEQVFSLNPGRYVGASAEDDGMNEEAFRVFMKTNAVELARLHAEAHELQQSIAEDLIALFPEANTERPG